MGVVRHLSSRNSTACNRPALAAPLPRRRFRTRVYAAAAAFPTGQPDLPANDAVPPPPAPPLAAPAAAEAAPVAAEGKSKGNGNLHLPNSMYAPFPSPKLPPDGSTLTAEELRCDPYTELCRTAIHVWESKCVACSGTGTKRNTSTAGGSSSRGGRGGGRHCRLGTCMLCSGLGYVRHTSNRLESVPYVNGTGPHTTLGRQPPPAAKPRRFPGTGGSGGSGAKK